MMVHPRVFISYDKADPSHPDTQFAQRLIADLSAAGVIVAASAGTNETMQRLNQALKHCHWLILVQTPAALASPQVRAEVDAALSLAAQGKMRGVLAMVVGLCALPPAWSAIRTFDAMQNYQQALSALKAFLDVGRPEAVTVMAGSGAQYAQPAGNPQYAQPGSSPQYAQAGGYSPPAPFNGGVAGPAAVEPSDIPTMFPRSGAGRRIPGGYSLRTLLITLLVLLLIVGGVGSFFLAKNAIITYNAGALSNAVHATTTAQAQNVANAALHSALNPYPPGGGTLAVNDALLDVSSAGNWEMSGACAIKNGAYTASEGTGGGFAYCYDQHTNFSNFVYQARVRIISGYAAGLVFRANVASRRPELYYFLISENGSYGLYLVTNHLNTVGQELRGGANATVIHTGPGQVNVMAVVARAHYLDFYVNMRYLFSVTDGSIGSGQIGVFAYDKANAAQAAFTFVKVWQL